MKEHLLHYFPFLKKEFRLLKDDELQSEEVFKELFPDEELDLSRLKAIAFYQQTTIVVSSESPNVDVKFIKKKNNAKV